VLIGTVEQFSQFTVYIRPVQEASQLPMDFDPASLGHPEEDDSIDDFLDRQVQLPWGEGRVPGRYVPGQSTAPLFQLGQEYAPGLGCAANAWHEMRDCGAGIRFSRWFAGEPAARSI
jgi:hypothetical protein